MVGGGCFCVCGRICSAKADFALGAMLQKHSNPLFQASNILTACGVQHSVDRNSLRLTMPSCIIQYCKRHIRKPPTACQHPHHFTPEKFTHQRTQPATQWHTSPDSTFVAATTVARAGFSRLGMGALSRAISKSGASSSGALVPTPTLEERNARMAPSASGSAVGACTRTALSADEKTVILATRALGTGASACTRSRRRTCRPGSHTRLFGEVRAQWLASSSSSRAVRTSHTHALPLTELPRLSSC
jgi:hypothetical protein